MSRKMYRVEFDNTDGDGGFINLSTKKEAVAKAKEFKDRRDDGFSAARVRESDGETLYKWWIDGQGQLRELDFKPILTGSARRAVSGLKKKR